MAQAKGGTNPVVALLANFCCFGILGYILIGQTGKALFVFLVTAVLSLCLGVGIVVAILGMIDVYQCAKALQEGEEVDANEYRCELLFKIMKIVHKDAVFNG